LFIALTNEVLLNNDYQSKVFDLGRFLKLLNGILYQQALMLQDFHSAIRDVRIKMIPDPFADENLTDVMPGFSIGTPFYQQDQGAQKGSALQDSVLQFRHTSGCRLSSTRHP